MIVRDEHWTAACLDARETQHFMGSRRYSPTDADVACLAEQLRTASHERKDENDGCISQRIA
jgi:hypothetical protein